MRRRCPALAIVLISLSLLSCAIAGREAAPPSAPQITDPTPTPTVEGRATATAVALDLKLFRATEECMEARGRIGGYDRPVPSNEEEGGQPSWEERFLAVDKVVRASMVSMTPQIVSVGGSKHYPAIRMEFRVLESFRGSFDLDYIVVWQFARHYYTSYNEANCVRLDEDISSLRTLYAHLDDREAILFLEETHKLDWLGGHLNRWGNYFIARLPSKEVSSDRFEGEQWRWLPQREGDTFYDRKFPADDPEADETGGTMTTQHLREIGRKIDRDLRGHDLECVYQAYRQARNFGGSLETLVKDCAW